VDRCQNSWLRGNTSRRHRSWLRGAWPRTAGHHKWRWRGWYLEATDLGSELGATDLGAELGAKIYGSDLIATYPGAEHGFKSRPNLPSISGAKSLNNTGLHRAHLCLAAIPAPSIPSTAGHHRQLMKQRTDLRFPQEDSGRTHTSHFIAFVCRAKQERCRVFIHTRIVPPVHAWLTATHVHAMLP
jgi:hypothetical protein